MRFVEKSIQWFVGGLFIFSGAVKVNDPVGTAIKLEEYFAVFSEDIAGFFQAFVPYALPMGIFLVVLEIVLGVALLANFRRKDTIRALMALVVFFTFLTFYSAYFNKVTDCGCFGDAIPLTPWQSFSKDVILLVLIGFLLLRLPHYENTAKPLPTAATVFSLVASLFVAYWAIEHLPFKDFRVYRKGANLPALMQAEVPCRYLYIVEKDGKRETLEEYPSDPSYVFKEMKIANEKECAPKITDYALTSAEGNDQTAYSLEGKRLLIIVHGTSKSNPKGFEGIKALVAQLEGTDIVPMLLTSDANIDNLRHEVQLAVPYYFADATVLKTMVRSNPGVLYLEKGIVRNKWHYNDVPVDLRSLAH